MHGQPDKKVFEELYARFNRREFVHPDPLEFLYEYDDPGDREIVGLVASCLAYGRVKQILASVRKVLSRMGKPSVFVRQADAGELRTAFKGFKHRFTTGAEIAALLYGTGRLLDEYGSLERCFAAGLSASDLTTVPALSAFVDRLCKAASLKSHLVPHPSSGSACKRLHLFLRWMVRRDEVDPGGWTSVRPSRLVVPVDTHMHRICLGLGLTRRKQADVVAALEVTAAFRKIAPQDPVKYDFAITRLGIRGDADPDELLGKCVVKEVV